MNKKKLLMKRRIKYQIEKTISKLENYARQAGLTLNLKYNLIDEYITTTSTKTKFGYQKEFLDIDPTNKKVRITGDVNKWLEKRVKNTNKFLDKFLKQEQIQDKEQKRKLTNYQFLKKQGYNLQEINEKLSVETGKQYSLSYKQVNKLSKKTIASLASAKRQEKWDDFYLENRDLIIEYNKAVGENKAALGGILKERTYEARMSEKQRESYKKWKEYWEKKGI